MSNTNSNEEFISEFLYDCHENLNVLDNSLIILEKEPDSRDTLSEVFRAVHTIKGSSGMLGFSKLESVSHAGESLLSLLREGKLSVDSEIVSALLSLTDAVRDILGHITQSHEEGPNDYAELIAALNRLSCRTASYATVSKAEQSRSILSAISIEPPELKMPMVLDNNIRVDVALLDRLMTLVGELVLTRNQVLQFSSVRDESAFTMTSQRLNQITTELQEGVMKTRMQPIGNIWNKFPRVVRDLAVMCGKKIRIEMEGQGTELDKTIIEAIKDPLMHIIRNTVDHGIETPEHRMAVGKPPEGRLLLSAYHEGGQVNIEISDDGVGINPERLIQKSVQRGFITAEQASRMSPRDALNLIFLPGLSTSDTITSISGRGVGMDVVKNNIEKIGGTVDIQSRPAHGTSIKLKIPLTLAIIPALIVTSNGARYAIPQVNLLELVRMEGGRSKKSANKGVEMIRGTPVFRLRGNLLPLVYLSRELQTESPASVSASRSGENSTYVIVLQTDDRTFGLVVDGVNDTEDIVVKPLGKQLKSVPVYAGATILGDGRVVLILDVFGIAQRANVVPEVSEHGMTVKADKIEKTARQAANMQTLLVFKSANDGRMAIPLFMVARLEKFSTAVVETSGDQDMVQYRGQIMPLIYVDEMLEHGRNWPESSSEEPAANALEVVVYSSRGRCAGLVVKQILDIVEESMVLQKNSCRKGILGSLVIQGKITELLDVEGLVRSINPLLSESEVQKASA